MGNWLPTTTPHGLRSINVDSHGDDRRRFDLISDALPFGSLWYEGPDAAANAIGYAQHHSRSHDAVIRVYDGAGNVTETHQYHGIFKDW